MADNLENRTFAIIDEIYQDLKDNNRDQELLDLALKAATALDKGVNAQIVATKMVNGFSLYILTHKRESFGPKIGQSLSELTKIARTGGYVWSSIGLGDLRVQF